MDHDNPAEMTGESIAGRYRLLEPLGRGAMSAVWLAHDDELERQVAVKMLAPSADRARFEREARAVAALSHPNICALYDYGEADGRPYMVLEYLPNGSLEDRLRDGQRLADDETLRIATGMAAGLAHAHGRGLVHRDLKPANVLFDAEERVKIADFGIARMGNAGTLTEAGTVLGTASYISPEQAGGLPAGPPSDVYSFGVILFRMLTGAFPFVSANAMELVRMHRDDPPQTVTAVRPGAPPQLAGIVTAALAKDPSARPPDGTALLQELRQTDETAATRVVPPRTPSRRPWPIVPIAAVAALLLVAGGALAIVLTNNSSSGGTTPPVSLTLPSVPSTPPTTAATTATAPTTAPAATTTAPPVTTTADTTTATTTTAVTTVPTTTAPPTTSTAPTTTAAPPTTTTAPPTTETTPTTTAGGTTTTALP